MNKTEKQEIKDMNEQNREETNGSATAVERARDSAAEGIGGAAGAVRKRSDSAHEYLNDKTDRAEESIKNKAGDAAEAARKAIEKGREAGHIAADRLSSTSDYLRNVDVDEIKARASERVRENPAIVIASAGIAGLLIGYLLGRRTG